ncbi:hypothetical protein AAE121_001111 [Salmonella enterica]
MSQAEVEGLHAAGVHAGNQTLYFWSNQKITFSHCPVFPDKTMHHGGGVGTLPCLIKFRNN